MPIFSYFGIYNQKGFFVLSISATNGSTIWNIGMNDTIDSLSPILSNDGNSVYIGVGTSIVRMDAETGNQPTTHSLL